MKSGYCKSFSGWPVARHPVQNFTGRAFWELEAGVETVVIVFLLIGVGLLRGRQWAKMASCLASLFLLFYAAGYMLIIGRDYGSLSLLFAWLIAVFATYSGITSWSKLARRENQ